MVANSGWWRLRLEFPSPQEPSFQACIKTMKPRSSKKAGNGREKKIERCKRIKHRLQMEGEHRKIGVLGMHAVQRCHYKGKGLGPFVGHHKLGFIPHFERISSLKFGLLDYK